jgi:hypothetical protein
VQRAPPLRAARARGGGDAAGPVLREWHHPLHRTCAGDAHGVGLGPAGGLPRKGTNPPAEAVTLLDPCCGSGTIPCIALGMHTVWGSDLQEDFLEKVGTSQ